MFVLQSKDALVVTKTGREVKRKGNLSKKKSSEQVRGQEPKLYFNHPLCLVWHTTAINLKKIRDIPIILTNTSQISEPLMIPATAVQWNTHARSDSLTDTFCIYK